MNEHDVRQEDAYDHDEVNLENTNGIHEYISNASKAVDHDEATLDHSANSGQKRDEMPDDIIVSTQDACDHAHATIINDKEEVSQLEKRRLPLGGVTTRSSKKQRTFESDLTNDKSDDTQECCRDQAARNPSEDIDAVDVLLSMNKQ